METPWILFSRKIAARYKVPPWFAISDKSEVHPHDVSVNITPHYSTVQQITVGCTNLTPTSN